MKYQIEKNTVQETLMLPLYARNLCTELFPSIFVITMRPDLWKKWHMTLVRWKQGRKH